MKPFLFKTTFCIFLIISSVCISAQVAAVKFTVHSPAITKEDKGVYIAGSFNYWHENDSLYRMKEIGNGVYTITIPVFANRQYAYKYTLGTWKRVEVALNDSDITNRQFTSVNRKNITDTVAKWRAPKMAVKTDSSAQLKKITAMKDSLAAKLKPQLGEMIGLLKSYVQNMLQEKPDMSEHQKLDEKATQKLGGAYKEITMLLWNIFASLTPEQKKEISKKLEAPANGDFINALGGALGAL